MGRGGPPARKRWLFLGATVLLLLALVLPPLINIGRYQRRIAASISQSIGRPVHMSSVSLRLLPMPAIQMSNFVVDEQAGFGSEPILRADGVLAYPRLSSLWRGRLEIARIRFDDPSVNLVRTSSGAWNFASILVQAAHSSTAPTGQRRPGPAPRFPYIEADNARIDFKEGLEKKPFSFLNADLSVWLDSPERWGVHFRAQPVRTDLDLDLGDSGVLRVDGTLKRAAVLSEMPLDLTARWTAAPLGELSRLVLGRDSGWRGNLDFQAQVRGPAANAHVKAVMKINSLHRAEFSPSRPLDVQAVCDAAYHKLSASLDAISCRSQAGGGTLALSGSLRHLQASPETELALRIADVPASAVLAGLQEIHDGFGEGLGAAGTLNGEFRYASSASGPPFLAGHLGISTLKLTASGDARPFVLSPVRFSFANAAPLLRGSSSKGGFSPLQPPALLLEPVHLALGAPTPLTIEGRLTLDGFAIHLSGDGSLSRLRGLNRVLSRTAPAPAVRLSSSKPAPGGSATVDVSLLGPWIMPVSDLGELVPPTTAVGSVVIRNAELTAPYLRRPLRILSAEALLSPTAIAWTNASIAYGSLQAHGSLEYSTQCKAGTQCIASFHLATPAWSLGDLQSSLLGSSMHDQLLREFLSRIDGGSANWPQLSGTVQIGTLAAGKLVVHDVAAGIELGGKSLRIQSLEGHLFKGALHLSGTVDVAGGKPAYDLALQVAGASPSQLAGVFGENWGKGAIGFAAHVKMAGFSAEDLAQSAAGTLRWDWKNGVLAGAGAPEPSAQQLNFSDWHGDATFADSTIRTTGSLMVRGSRTLPVSGTISFDRQLDLKCGSSPGAFTIAGNLERPRMEATSGVAARRPTP